MVEQKLLKIDDLARNVDRISLDVDSFKIRSIPPKHDINESLKAMRISINECKERTAKMHAKRDWFVKTLCDVLGFREFDDCSLNLHLVNSTIKKPMRRINDVLIVANRNYVTVDFIVLDIDCNPTCHIILGRPFLKTIGAIIDMKEGNIRFQFPLRKSMEHFTRNKIKLPNLL
jgi:hypothetical protein